MCVVRAVRQVDGYGCVCLREWTGLGDLERTMALDGWWVAWTVRGWWRVKRRRREEELVCQGVEAYGDNLGTMYPKVHRSCWQAGRYRQVSTLARLPRKQYRLPRPRHLRRRRRELATSQLLLLSVYSLSFALFLPLCSYLKSLRMLSPTVDDRQQVVGNICIGS